MSTTAEVFSEVVAELGEGPLWDGEARRLVWVDIDGRRVHVTSADGSATRSYATPAPVGAVALQGDERGRSGTSSRQREERDGSASAARQRDEGERPASSSREREERDGSASAARQRDGELLLALGAGFARLSLDDGEIVPLADAPGTDPAVARMNDAAVDPAGRWFAGTKAYDDRPGGGTLYRLDRGGRVTPVLEGVTISNGMAWSADGSTLFYIDTPTRTIARFPFELADGTLGERSVHADTSALTGSPDGMTIDADGNVWVAFWGGWCVRCFSGADGTLLEEIAMPVAQCTSLAFGGEDLRRLHVTTARAGLSEEQLRDQPDAGRVHVLEPGVAGVPARRATV